MLKSAVKHLFHSIGYDIRKYDPHPPNYLAMSLRAHGINLIFDVGANIGQFATGLRGLGYTGRIVSFEPLAEEWNRLYEAGKADPLWEVAPRAAIGSEDGEIEMHRAGNSWSSSALPMLDAHLNAAPESAYTGFERAPLRRLDSAGSEYLRPDSKLVIKIDTQGFEHEVIKGSPKLLGAAAGVHIELSMVPLYQGQVLYDDLIAQLKSLGFKLWAFDPIFFDQKSGRLLCADATFYRD
ncbi:MAG TPA: FkbM family methyltransferase [Bryobacteraceae bacterium]|nr:FkbM family methyltransferase [Bryobacteraceae bacterium]